MRKGYFIGNYYCFNNNITTCYINKAKELKEKYQLIKSGTFR